MNSLMNAFPPQGRTAATAKGYSDIPDDADRAAQRARIVAWVWGVVQVLAGFGLGFAVGRFVPDPMAAQLLKTLLPFTGVLFGVGHIVREYQTDAVLRREMRAIKRDILAWQTSAQNLYKDTAQQLLALEVADLKTLLPVFNSYIACGSNDRFGHRDRLLGQLRLELDEIARGRWELDGDDYYAWLKHRLVERIPREVLAISLRPLSVYATDAREKNFINNNSLAVVKGTQITRVFILSESELISKDARSVVRSQFVDSGVKCYVAWKAQIGPDAVRKLAGGGLSIYDDEELFHDQSYFEHILGDQSASQTSRPVRPRAIVFSNAHPQFQVLRQVFRHVLENTVDPAQRDRSGIDAYHWVCGYVLAWAEGNSAVSDSDREELRRELNSLVRLQLPAT